MHNNTKDNTINLATTIRGNKSFKTPKTDTPEGDKDNSTAPSQMNIAFGILETNHYQ
jgi:hypothetical protein